MPIPNVTVSASRPDAACTGVAPTALSPAITTTNDDVNPTRAVTIPATIGSLRVDGAVLVMRRHNGIVP